MEKKSRKMSLPDLNILQEKDDEDIPMLFPKLAL